MAFLRNMASFLLVILVLSAWLVWTLDTPSRDNIPANDDSYRQFVPLTDAEQRHARLGNAADDPRYEITAFVGLPEAYSSAVSAYVESVFSAIKAEPLTRRHHYHPGPHFPYNPTYDRDCTVPIVVLPRPDVVRRRSRSPSARSLGWISESDAPKRRSSVFGRTLIFEPGVRSRIYVKDLAVAVGAEVPWDLDEVEVSSWGKVVVGPGYGSDDRLQDRTASLRIGEAHGAKFVAEFISIPVHIQNRRLRWATVKKGEETRTFLAYSLVDGNGLLGRKNDPVDATAGKVSKVVRRLVCERHQPRIGDHDELLLPGPLGWAPTEKQKWKYKLDDNPHEEWCLDDWFPAQHDACWVLREAEDSVPLQESFLLMSATESSDLPVFFIALFGETQPAQLVTELATLYRVSPDAVLQSPEVMRPLESLYQAICDFPFPQ